MPAELAAGEPGEYLNDSADEPSLNSEWLAELYAARPEDFVAQRDALARTLRQAGNKRAASRVKSLRRPTVAAWALNQLAREQPDAMARLLSLGERLREAHKAVLSGQATSALRELTVERRDAVGALADRGVALLGAGGGPQREAITNTLEAAAADPKLGTAVMAGRLSKELPAPSGFGGLDLIPPAHDDLEVGLTPTPTSGDNKKPRKGGDDSPEHDEDPEQRRAQEQREGEERRQRLRADAEAKEAEAAMAANEADDLRAQLQALQERLAVAEALARAAASAAAEARAAMEEPSEEAAPPD